MGGKRKHEVEHGVIPVERITRAILLIRGQEAMFLRSPIGTSKSGGERDAFKVPIWHRNTPRPIPYLV